MAVLNHGIFMTCLATYILVYHVEHVLGQRSCNRITPCKCAFDDGREIDLSPLGRDDGKPRFNQTAQSENTFLWNPCYSFNFSNACEDVAMCEIHPDLPSNRIYSLGIQETVLFTEGPEKNSVQLIYSSKEGGSSTVRTAFVILECTTGDVDNTTFEASGEKPIGSNSFYFVLRSPVACPRSQITTEGPTTSVETSKPTKTTDITPTSSEPSNPSMSTSLHPSSETMEPSSSETPTVSSPTSPGKTSISRSTSTAATVHPNPTPKPDKSKTTLKALLICAVMIIVGLAVALTLVVLKMKGKICKQKEYDNL